MTIVHYRDKRTGRVQVYESTPNYDPKTKQSRPKRKYLGTLDPVTGELVPSSGRPGRRPGSRNLPKAADAATAAPVAVASEAAGPVADAASAEAAPGTPPPPSLAEAGEQRDELERRVEELERELERRVEELERCKEALRGVADAANRAVGSVGAA